MAGKKSPTKDGNYASFDWEYAGNLTMPAESKRLNPAYRVQVGLVSKALAVSAAERDKYVPTAEEYVPTSGLLSEGEFTAAPKGVEKIKRQ